MTNEELQKRYGSQLRDYARGRTIRPSDEVLAEVLTSHMTGFLPHMGGFKDQSKDFQRLTLLLHRELGREARRWRDGYSWQAVPAGPDDTIEWLEPGTFTITHETG